MAAVEKSDRRDAGPDISVKETAGTTTSVNGGEDIVPNDKPDVSDVFEDDDESLDSSFHLSHSLRRSPQNAEAHARSSLLPSSSSLQPDRGGSEANPFPAPPRPSCKIRRYPCEV